jgi:BirA family transcriptional regulator, biotin operon repressor / biotin---[acetyl-CoA-carboxylase] ligase
MPDTVAATWDGLSAEALARRCGVPRLELLAETESTQDVAHMLAEEGAPAGTTVLADAQRAGRGRLGRSWMSETGRGVWCTILERPMQTDAMDVLSLRIGLEIAEALDTFAGGQVGVKWPNDLMLPHAVIQGSAATRDPQFGKLGGILVEARWSGSTLAWVAIGVGVNVVAPNVPGASGLARDPSRTAVLTAIVRAVRSAAATTGSLSGSEMARYRARDVLAGRRILEPVAGIVAGITESGSLVVETERGTEHFRAGTVRPAEGEDA